MFVCTCMCLCVTVHTRARVCGCPSFHSRAHSSGLNTTGLIPQGTTRDSAAVAP